MISRYTYKALLMSMMAALLISTSACTPKIANRGTVLEAEQLEKVTVGKSTREEVLETLGSPTQVSTFDENIWYYISRTTKQTSFLDPKIVAQRSVVVRFNDQGIVSKLNEFDAGAAKKITPVARKTPTYGRQTTFLEQLMGNVGRPGSLSKGK